MPLHHLALFSKDTDANATIKGYEFQKLRTLEIWLESYLAKSDEITYCEYQDDIFSRDTGTWVSNFRQLKLYSSKNFSFKSEEVTKAIYNFFMLFVKGEFKFDDVQFWFETNTGIARNQAGNGADLLKEWHQHQGQLSPELLARCTAQIKETVIAELKNTSADIHTVPNEVWEDFTLRIHWQFDDIDPETALENVIIRIRSLIAKITFPIAQQQPKAAFYCLIYEISKRSMADQAEGRKLDSELLDKLLLTTIDQLETGYAEDWESWHNMDTLAHFRASEFYQVMGAAYYCNQNRHLHHHLGFWQGLLQHYIVLDDTPLHYRRRAISELIWCVSKNFTTGFPLGSLLGLEPHIRLYFGTIAGFQGYESVAEAIHLLVPVFLHVHEKTCELDLKEPLLWQRQIRSLINKHIGSAESPEAICYYNQLAALLIHLDITETLSKDSIKDALPFYRAILNTLDQAQRYNVVALAAQINQWLDRLMKDGTSLDDMEPLQEFADQLIPFVNSRENDESNALRYNETGNRYLETTDRNGVLKALTCFHKAKALYRQDRTRKGYVLALLNIGQLYNVAGCNLAAKYYSMSAAWHCSQHEQLHDLLPDAMGLLYHMDHAQGAWLSSMEAFRLYINARAEFNTKGYDLLDKNLQELAFVISAGPRIAPQTQSVMEQLKRGMGQFYDLYLEHYVIEDDELTSKEIDGVVQAKLDDTPFNDAGKTRTIEWHAGGLSWKISFENTWLMNSVAEEFCAILQVLLLELMLSKHDLHLLEIPLEVELKIRAGGEEPLRAQQNKAKWTVYIPAVLDEDYQAIEQQVPTIVANIAILLQEVSLLPGEELTELITKHFDQENLAGKTLPDFIYQRLYRHLFSRASFEQLSRTAIGTVNSTFTHKTFRPLKWLDTLSAKYDRDGAMEMIRQRYEGFTLNSHLTLKKIKDDPAYPEFIGALRTEGWLDWQILMAIRNFILSKKANALLLGRRFPSEAERVAAYQREGFRLQSLPEEENYIPLVLSDFSGSSLRNQLNNTAKLVLMNFDLDYQVQYPVFEALLRFVRARLRFGEDDIKELSPL
ncbi:dsDNA nuclease domain-containing protein [Mucilaginibacter auburnensis]|uniref:Uncharacterized protein DUF4297 n=1 Tax=Mucilaginibacter auburnensis TaxID=1457233 RepID=A0A2H9VR36_9SPHI|nr:dsDNA nuclease domain-containing protein [Mucilaginibacter auburnensis]PJJ83296.1 uncharacterized protein DUF4297 [Mucilaginibacter auburnensis]